MLFHVTSEFVGVSEDSERRHFTVFNQWQPPAELEFKAFYNFADNSGGVAIVEFDDAATLARTTATWMPWLRFRTTPIEPVPNMIAIRGEAIAFRDSVRSRAPLAGRGLLTRKGLGRRSEGGPARLSGPRPSRRSRRARRR